MKTRLLVTTAVLLGALSFGVVAEQQDHQEQHPEGAPKSEAAPVPAPPAQKGMPKGKMMQGMPQECQAAMKSMPSSCMKMMMQMMGGMGGQAEHTSTHGDSSSPATKAYIAAAESMHGPMMQVSRRAIPMWPLCAE